MATRVSPYHVLGLPSTATRQQVKEAFRKLCLQYHPDKVTGETKAVAETRFRNIKSAYDEILKGQAGYAPPPPGTSASANYARAYWRAQHGGADPEGPVRCGGPFGGYATESDFYRSMFFTTRNNPFVLILTGLAAIPVVSLAVSVANGNTGFIKRFADEGIFMFTQNRFKINGRDAVRTNPFSIRSDGTKDRMEDSYIFKNEKYKHFRASMTRDPQAAAAAAAGAEGAPAPACGNEARGGSCNKRNCRDVTDQFSQSSASESQAIE